MIEKKIKGLKIVLWIDKKYDIRLKNYDNEKKIEKVLIRNG